MRILSTLLLALCLTLSAVPAAAQFGGYDNGPTNGNTDAWTINFGFMVSNSFTLRSGMGVGGLTFAAWVFPGDVLQTVEVSITSNAFFGTTYYDQTVNFIQSGCVSNQYGYNVCNESGNLESVGLNPGTYWLTLRNASVNTGDPIYWDENSGPSRALTCCDRNLPEGGTVRPNALGTIPSESFTLLGYGCGAGGGCADGTASSTTPELGSFVLFGSGVLGLAGVLRRKLF
jgi:hypothetical protein